MSQSALDHLPDLPESTKTGLDQLCSQLQEALEGRLVSIVLYGGLVRGEYSPDRSDVNVMVVLDAINVEVLDKVALPIQLAEHDIRAAVLLLTERDLRSSTDVFPLRLVNMQRCHRVLLGKDVLSGLQVERDHLRLRCEQEIRNLQYRLRDWYLERAHFAEALEETLSEAISSLLETLRVLVELHTGALPRSRAEIIDAMEGLGLQGTSLHRVLALKKGELEVAAPDVKQLFDEFLTVVHEAVGLADKL